MDLLQRIIAEVRQNNPDKLPRGVISDFEHGRLVGVQLALDIIEHKLKNALEEGGDQLSVFSPKT